MLHVLASGYKMQVTKLVLTLSLALATGHGRRSFEDDQANASNIKLQPAEEDEGEAVEIQTHWNEDGSAQLDFTSHNRHHHLDLKESRIDLSQIPVRLLGSSEEFQQQVNERLKNVKLMRDKERGAFAAFESKDDQSKPVIQQGSLQLGGQQFDVKKDSASGKMIASRKFAKVGASKRRDKVILKEGERIKRSTTTTEYKNVTARVEMVWLLDYSVWIFFHQRNAVDLSTFSNSDFTVNILTYFAHIAGMIDDYFETIVNDELKIAVDLVGMVLITSGTEARNLIQDHVDSRERVSEVGILERLSAWLKSDEGKSKMPPYDHVMLATMYDLIDDQGESDVNGLAFLGKICDPGDSTSLLEANDVMGTVANTAAHELGHNLGSDHDNEGASSACAANTHIMDSAGGDTNQLNYRSLFSCCSQRAFYATINEKGGCLKTTSGAVNFDESISTNVQQNLPGQVFTADDQCYIKMGTQACEAWVYADLNTNMCRRLYCKDSANGNTCSDFDFPAADGTECDTGKWCLKGECVAMGDVRPNIDSLCTLQNCFSGEKKCTNGTNTLTPGMYKCYKDSHRCDGIMDCSDNSDEPCGDVEKTCPEHYKPCPSGISLNELDAGVNRYCAAEEWFCDEEEDCTDGSEEVQMACDACRIASVLCYVVFICLFQFFVFQ